MPLPRPQQALDVAALTVVVPETQTVLIRDISQLVELLARRMRLKAERDGALQPLIPDELSDRMDENAVATVVNAEVDLHAARRRMLAGQKRQLQERIGQIQQEREGLAARRVAKDDELALIAQELKGVEKLHKKGLTPFTRVAALQRARAQLAGDRGQLTAEIARAGTRISETELQTLQLDKEQLTEALNELRETDGRIDELRERRVAALDELNRVDMRAPQSGVIHELAVHTIGGVIAAGDTVLSIVPVDNALQVEAKLRTADIDQVHPGQTAILRFSAFNQRTMPELNGRAQSVSAALSEDAATGTAWYEASIELSAEELERLDGFPPIPRRLAAASIQTGERTALSWLFQPISDQFARPMRERNDREPVAGHGPS